MARAMTGYGLGLGLLTISGLLLDFGGSGAASANQFNLFMVLLRAYTPLLTPFSSALGYPIIGGAASYGIIPLLIWVFTAFFLGILMRNAGSGAKAMFLASSTIVMIWIASLFFSAPAWPDNSTWLSAVNKMAADLVSKPIDLCITLALPTASSAITGQITHLIQNRVVKQSRLEENYSLF